MDKEGLADGQSWWFATTSEKGETGSRSRQVGAGRDLSRFTARSWMTCSLEVVLD